MRIRDLGARRENMNQRDKLNYLFEQFDIGTTERRLCNFLNQMEVELKRYDELKSNTGYLSIKELQAMKK